LNSSKPVYKAVLVLIVPLGCEVGRVPEALFFPGEASSERLLRMQLKEGDTGRTHLVLLNF
jgi:hypothetical protein